MRDPKAILADDEIRAAGFDLDAPACVVLACVLPFVDAETAQGIVSTFVQALAPGSYVVISRQEITGLFAGLELVRPGIVETSAWLPGQPDMEPEERSNMVVAGVGRRA